MPAIAGLAKKFSYPNIAAYLASYWENYLFRSLCWTSMTRGGGRSGGESEIPQAVVKHRGLSWSWVSADSAVDMSIGSLFLEYRRGALQVGIVEAQYWKGKYCP